MTILRKNLYNTAIAGLAAVLLFCVTGSGTEQKGFHEEAQFEISVGGRNIGQEKFSIQASGNSARSSSVITFSDPSNPRQSVKMETELTMDGRFVPTGYQLRTDANGQKGIIRGTFAPGQASFEYISAGGPPRKTGLLVGERYIVLDTNVFHHFVFIARLFDFQSSEKTQSIEVIIPQEMQNGLLKVTDLGIQKASVRGKQRDLHHLKADSGSVQIDLWVDDNHTLQMITMPSKRLEVVRK